MRGVTGLLGRTEKDGSSDPDLLSQLIPHLNRAFKKPAADDRLIFIDVNGDPGAVEGGASNWIQRAAKRLEQYEKKELPEGESAYVFVTDMPFHRMLHEPLSIAALPFGVGVRDFNRPGNYRLSEAYRLKQKHADAYDIGEALAKYPQLPSTFDGSLPSEGLHGEKSRVLIGETYHFDGIGDEGLTAKVTSAIVNETEKTAYIGTDKGRILSYPMSDEAIADYRENPDAYFGQITLSTTKPLNDIYELFEWLMKTHRHLSREALLQKLSQVSGCETLSDEELLAIYCEGMAASFQKSMDADKQAPTAVKTEIPEKPENANA